MGKKRIFTVGFDLPGEDFEYVPIESDKTLLDADIITFEPSIGDHESLEEYAGKPLLTEYSSFIAKERVNHWHNEIVAAINSGKLVIVYLIKPEEYYRHTGEKKYSGTGRSRATTNIVCQISSYESVPELTSVTAKSGENIRIVKSASYLAPYWKEFSKYSTYQVEISGDFTHILLQSLSGNRIVGASIHSKSGAILYLPPLCYNQEKFAKYSTKNNDYHWTKSALQFGVNLAACLANLYDTLRKSVERTPPPTWTEESKYQLEEENSIEKQISKVSTKITKLREKKIALEGMLQDAGGLRRLLYEQGKPLENVLIEVLTMFGFKAVPFDDGESEFDVVFHCTESRCLGEAEGKDNKAINIDKMSQLERNLQEDFARNEVKDFAKGVLFGNAFRLTAVEKRGAFFTTKCISAAKRGRIALVKTPDLFGPAKYLKQHPNDKAYAKQCRDAIVNTEGEEVQFPEPPIQDPEPTVSKKQQRKT